MKLSHLVEYGYVPPEKRNPKKASARTINLIKRAFKKFNWDTKFFDRVVADVLLDYEDGGISTITIHDVAEIVDASPYADDIGPSEDE